jgi:hypothetical protein
MIVRPGAATSSLALVLGLFGCSRTLGGPGTAQPGPSATARLPHEPVSPGAASAATAGSVTPAGSTATAAVPAAVALDGCAAGADPTLRAEPLLQALKTQCVHGMTPLVPRAQEAELGAGQSVELAFHVVDATHCIRAMAAGDASIEGLMVRVDDRVGHTLHQSPPGARIALLGAEGPVCLDQAGDHLARATVVKGRGRVALMLWQAR